jgi:succinate-semialdehyde dehydrogenase/glutarate-semialdehyde dehydrogenase
MIIKPAPETPFSALTLVKLALEAGIPANVLQVVTGDAEPIADAFMESPLVRKLSFTGSTEVGKILIRRSAETIKRLTLELGGNAPFIVFEDADLEKAVQGAIFAKYRNAGQTCICVNRFLVHEKVSDQFAQRLHEATAKLKVGNGHDDGVEVGPLINAEAKAKVMRLLADAKDRGAKTYSEDNQKLEGLYCQPTVITGVTPQMAIWQEEIFGPIASITNFKDEEHLLELAHNTEAGLAAYVYTRDLSRAWRVCEALEYGMVGLNDALISAPQAPFGGVKESGYGREGGHQGIEEYLHLKYISIGL